MEHPGLRGHQGGGGHEELTLILPLNDQKAVESHVVDKGTERQVAAGDVEAGVAILVDADVEIVRAGPRDTIPTPSRAFLIHL